MFDDKQEKQAGAKETETESLSHSKRRLVKSGALAVPVVLTLRSGAALAMASAKQCIDNNQTEAQGADPLITASEIDDNVWVRKEVDCRKLEGDGGVTFYVYKNPFNPDQWLREDDNVPFIEVLSMKQGVRKKTEGNVQRSLSFAQQNQTLNNVLMVEENPVDPNPPKFTVLSEETNCKVLVLVDSQGQLISFGRSGADEVAITQSCWASINPGVIP